MARLFFAVRVSREVSSQLRRLVSRLERAVPHGCLRFSEPDQAHFTLRFLGEESAERQAAALRAASAACGAGGSFDLELGSLGVFPDERRPHTLWIGAGLGAGELTRLAAGLEQCLFAEGFAREERPFVPHLTIGRIKQRLPPGSLKALLGTQPEAMSGLRVESFDLMESRTTSAGPRYTSLETFRLETSCTRSR